MATDFSNTTDVIDSRDVIERIEELEADFEEWQENNPDAPSDVDDALILASGQGEDWADELAGLLALQSEAESSPDWAYGEALIHEDYFVEYCEELVRECYHDVLKGIASDDTPWWLRDAITIDWEQVADALRQDYMEVEFADATNGSQTYLIRC